MKDLFVLTSFARMGGAALKQAAEFSHQKYSCDICSLWSPPGCGMSRLLHQLAELHRWLVVDIPAAPSERTLANALGKAVWPFGDSYYGSDQTRYQAVQQLLKRGSPLLIFDNADRLATRGKEMLIDITRDVGDASGCSIVYASNDGLQRLLSAAPTHLLEATRSRIRSACELPRPSRDDAGLLASELSGVEIGPIWLNECSSIKKNHLGASRFGRSCVHSNKSKRPRSRRDVNESRFLIG